jgi:hypothetical protein
MDKHISDYGKVYANGVKWVQDVFNGPVVVQEKVDGSQFSFGVIDGELIFRSRKCQMDCNVYEGMFANGVKAIEEIKDLLTPGLIYRAEYLSKPKHNSLAYDRVPERYVILFDIENAISPGDYWPFEDVQEEAERLGLECVATYAVGKFENAEMLLPLLENKPVLGGPYIEGIVIKNYALPDIGGGFMKAKIVREDFKEVHAGEWGKTNPSSKDIISAIIDSYRTEARWGKSIQHLRDAGTLQDAPQDIGELIKAVVSDVLEEEAEAIRELLFRHFWKDISRGITRGLPEYYKRKLNGIEIGIDGIEDKET